MSSPVFDGHLGSPCPLVLSQRVGSGREYDKLSSLLRGCIQAVYHPQLDHQPLDAVLWDQRGILYSILVIGRWQEDEYSYLPTVLLAFGLYVVEREPDR